ncbi:hypothetical protein HPB52_022685 [Rhipicephalus sanguineus]|uniref:Uncharacterized protein n=1 Tax=Rhipicephalus sanguineus TaxID=34632 RepID=A0A9D4STI1_RHISA|nr:hypothetical protein HPB52_022685 [Rhipicephalus sanguineus]
MPEDPSSDFGKRWGVSFISNPAGTRGLPETKEAVTKLAYERCLSSLTDARWAREVYKYLHLRSIRMKFGAVQGGSNPAEGPFQRYIRKKVQELVRGVETERWREGKTDIAEEAFYDNYRGSGLLCEARSVPSFHPAYPRAWFMRLDAILAVNGLKAQSLMHAVLLNALPVELCQLATRSSSSPRAYDDLCAAVLA